MIKLEVRALREALAIGWHTDTGRASLAAWAQKATGRSGSLAQRRGENSD